MTVVFMDPSPLPNKGFDAISQYQMVPAHGGVRGMGIWLQADEPEDVIVYCADPNKAHLWGLYVIQGHAAIQGSGYFIKRDSAIRFFIGGRDPGPTTLIVESVTGKPRGFLLLSVKSQLKMTYQVAVLSDPFHVPPKDIVAQNLVDNMSGAAKLWLEQANVVLEKVGGIIDAIVPFDLGNSIVIDDPVNLAAIAKASLTPQQVPANLFIYGTWDLIYASSSTVIGSNTLNMCFVENQFVGRVGQLLCAHEVGHALTLPHSSQASGLLMSPLITNVTDRLDMWDVEMSNRL